MKRQVLLFVMPLSRPSRLFPFWLALGGLAFAAWLTIFFHDARRPATPQERADRLAAANYSAGALSASTPPSPEHWAQFEIWLDDSGQRRPIAREASALLLALCGRHERVAGIMAFGLASFALGWVLRVGSRLSAGIQGTLIGIALLAVAHGRDWQMTDPTPFLVLALAAAALAAWLELRAEPTRSAAWFLGVALAGLLLAAPPLALLIAAAIAADCIRRGGPAPAAAWPRLRDFYPAIALLCIVLAAGGLRNRAQTGSVFHSASDAYIEQNVTAPRWFWQKVSTPSKNSDPTLERYDELVAIPSTRWSSPVYSTWLNRVREGADYAAGSILAIAALVSALLLRGRSRSPAVACLGMIALALVYFPLSASWWPVVTPALVLLIAWGAETLASAASDRGFKKLLLAGVILQVALLPGAPVARPSTAEYDFARRLEDVAKKILEKPGNHLVFVSMDDSSDASLEAADLPRNWSAERILFARELGARKDGALVAAMPGYTAWRMMVFRDRVGLLPWKAAPSTPPTPEPSALSSN